MLIRVMYAEAAALAMFGGIVMPSEGRDVVVVTAPQCGQTAPPCRNADAEPGLGLRGPAQ